MLWWERARDISVLIDKLLGDPQFGAHIDPSRIGVAGFSLGGYTALATVGARLEYQQWKTFCATQPLEPNCTLPPEASFSMANVQQLLDHDDRVKEAVSHSHESFRDARIRAALAIAPVLGPVMTKASLAEVGVPVRIIVGSKDDQAFPDVNARPIASSCTTPSSPDATSWVKSLRAPFALTLTRSTEMKCTEGSAPMPSNSSTAHYKGNEAAMKHANNSLS